MSVKNYGFQFTMKVGRSSSPDGGTVRGAAKGFRAGWDKAREDGVDISPELRKALIEGGVHPERVEDYMDHLMDPKRDNPSPKDYSQKVVVNFSELKK